MKTIGQLALTFLLAFSACLHTAAQTPVWAEDFNAPGFDGPVYAIAQTADAVFYGGNFDHVGSVAANNIARVDKVTGVVTPLGNAAQNGTNSDVYALAVSGTNLFVGGAFTTVSSSTQNAVSANRIAQWSTTGSTWSPLGSAAQNGTDDAVTALAVGGTDVFVGGGFTTVSSSTQNAVSANRIAQWSTTGSTWSPLGSAAQNGTNNLVNALAVSGTDLFVGGYFNGVSSSTQNAISANSVAQWSTTGSTWSPLGSAAQNGTDFFVAALAVSGTDLFVGGDFNTVSSSTQNAISANKVARWSTTGSTWSPLGSAAQNGTNGVVYALAVSGTDLFAGGIFNTVSSAIQNGISSNNIAKWTTAGSTWSALGSAAQNGTDSDVYALAVSGTNVLVGGFFTAVSSSTQNALFASHIAQWSTTTSDWGVPVISGDGIDGEVYAVVDAGAVVYVGGAFSHAGNVAANNVACWTKSTRTWSALGSAAQNGTDNSVLALAVSGTNLFVGGAFTSVSSSTQNAISANYVAQWSTTGSTWSPLGSAAQNGTEDYVNALAVSGANLFVGGEFITVSSSTQNAISANYVAQWSTTGSTWSPLGGPLAAQNGTNDFVFALAVSGTNLFVGGDFFTVNSSTQSAISAKCIAQWSTTGSTWSPLGSAAQNGTNTAVNALAVSGTNLFVGGWFDNVSSSTQNAISANYVAQWSTTGSTWSPLGSAAQNGTNDIVYALAVSGTDVFVGGFFDTVSSSTQNAISANYIAQWSTTGSTWSPLGSAAQNGTNDTVYALAVSGTNLLSGGAFTSVSSSTQNAIASNHLGEVSFTSLGDDYYALSLQAYNMFIAQGDSRSALIYYFYYAYLGDLEYFKDSGNANLTWYYLAISHYYFYYWAMTGNPIWYDYGVAWARYAGFPI